MPLLLVVEFVHVELAPVLVESDHRILDHETALAKAALPTVVTNT